MKKVLFISVITLLISGCVSSAFKPAATLTPQPVTSIPLLTPIFSGTPISQVTTESPTVAPTPTPEMSSYYDRELGIRISYPKPWAEISPGKFIGKGGYLVIKKLENYHSRKLDHVALDFANTYYSQYEPLIYCMGYGRNGCAITMQGSDPSGNKVDKVVEDIPYESTSTDAEYFSMETTRQYYIQISESIIWNTNAFEPTSTSRPTPIPNPIVISSDGVILAENPSQKFIDSLGNPVNNLGGEIIGAHCGVQENNEDSEFVLSSDNASRISIRKNNETVYRYSGWMFNAPNPWLFCTWDKSWAMETHEIVIVNGWVLNHEIGYEEVFGWHLLGGEPVYFVGRNDSYFISVNGKILPVQYDEIQHYLCCGLQGGNPYTNGLYTIFHAKRKGVWYSVLVSIK